MSINLQSLKLLDKEEVRKNVENQINNIGVQIVFWGLVRDIMPKFEGKIFSKRLINAINEKLAPDWWNWYAEADHIAGQNYIKFIPKSNAAEGYESCRFFVAYDSAPQMSFADMEKHNMWISSGKAVQDADAKREGLKVADNAVEKWNGLLRNIMDMRKEMERFEIEYEFKISDGYRD